MSTLPDFKKDVEEIHERCVHLFANTQEPYTTLTQELQKRKQECESQLKDFGPKIMFFGNYNAGKSTLLNALLGEEKAAVGDVPVTYKEDTYEWKGYNFLDTPGVNAPIEHEELTLRQVELNDVVLFVISSSGSFEDKQIYEHMRNIFNKGKQLIIVINNKNGFSASDKNLLDIKSKVIKNLQEMAPQIKTLETISIHVVNAEEALEGRLNNEQEMVEASGILSLEEAILRELRRVDSFTILRRMLENLKNSLQNAVVNFDAMLNKDGDSKTLSRYLQDELREGIVQIRAMVERTCGGFDNALFAHLPKPEAADSVANETISKRFAEELQNYTETVNKELNLHIPVLLQRLADAVRQRMPEDLDIMIKAETMDVVIPDMPSKVVATTVSVGASESDNMLGTKISAAVAILPKVLPLPPPILIATTLIGPVVDACRAIFGKSKDEQHRAQLEADVTAHNEAERQNALNIAIWRQEAREACVSYANRAMRELQNRAQDQVERLATVYLTAARRMEEEHLTAEKKVIMARDACFEQVRAIQLLYSDMK